MSLSSPSHSLMNGDLQGKANKAQVTVMADMDQRQLAFSINGAPPVLATKHGGLPSKVRPWVHMFKEHDSVTIARPQELSAGASWAVLGFFCRSEAALTIPLPRPAAVAHHLLGWACP